jgi:hypothetical protein
VEGRGNRIGGVGEGAHHAVALALLYRPNSAVEGDGRFKQFIMTRDRRAHRALVTLPKTGRSFDVAEKECDDSGGQRRGTRQYGVSTPR